MSFYQRRVARTLAPGPRDPRPHTQDTQHTQHTCKAAAQRRVYVMGLLLLPLSLCVVVAAAVCVRYVYICCAVLRVLFTWEQRLHYQHKHRDTHTDTLLRLHNVRGCHLCVCVISVCSYQTTFGENFMAYTQKLPKPSNLEPQPPSPQTMSSHPILCIFFLLCDLFNFILLQTHSHRHTHTHTDTNADRLILMCIGIGVFKIL